MAVLRNSKASVNYKDVVLDRDRRASRCDNWKKHTKCPEGYLQWHAWAEQKSKTHRTERCPGCGLYTIWVPKKKRARRAA